MIKKNILANFIGRFWSILSGFLFIPLYIKYLGVESYSVISFSLVIAGVMAILDAGLSSTLAREFAINTNSKADKIRIFCTLETCYLIISLAITIIVWIFSNAIAHNWLILSSLDSNKTSFYIKLIGIGISFRLLADFYLGGILGLEKQIKANVFQISWGITRNGLVLIPLVFWPTLEVFFIWQTIATVIYAVILRFSLSHELSNSYFISKMFSIEKSVLEKTWKFAGGMMLISCVFAVNTQMDKIAISKLLPINQLGYYTLAVSLAQGIALLAFPISTAVLPRLTSLYSEKKIEDASLLFNKMLMLVSILVLSIAFNIMLNDRELLWIWTGNHDLALKASPFVPYLVVGMVMASLQLVPYNVAIANGFTKLNNLLGAISFVITLPGYWLMTKYFGAIGAAITWCIVQSLITPFYFHLVIKRFLPLLSTFHVLLHKILKPALLAFIVSFSFTFVKTFSDQRFEQFIWISISTFSTLFISAIFLVNKRQYSFVFTWIKSNKSNS